MKYITFVVPCYNGAKYLDKCIPTLVLGGEEVEVIIINDGSTDNTLEVANSYAKKYPGIVSVIDKENGGHGSGINRGLEKATGLYFKVMDCDDWADEESYPVVLNTIKENAAKDLYPDEYITKFYFDHPDTNYKYALPLEKMYPTGVMFSWNKVRTHYSSTVMLHSFFFKTSMLKENNVSLLEHCFYEDCELVYKAMIHTNTMFFINTIFYHYYIGRVDQSVSKAGIEKHHADYGKVCNSVWAYKTYDEILEFGKDKSKAIFKYIFTILYISYFATYNHASKAKKQRYKEIVKGLKRDYPELGAKIFHRTPYVFTILFFPPLRQPMLTIGNKIVMGKTGWAN